MCVCVDISVCIYVYTRMCDYAHNCIYFNAIELFKIKLISENTYVGFLVVETIICSVFLRSTNCN